MNLCKHTLLHFEPFVKTKSLRSMGMENRVLWIRYMNITCVQFSWDLGEEKERETKCWMKCYFFPIFFFAFQFQHCRWLKEIHAKTGTNQKWEILNTIYLHTYVHMYVHKYSVYMYLLNTYRFLKYFYRLVYNDIIMTIIALTIVSMMIKYNLKYMKEYWL